MLDEVTNEEWDVFTARTQRRHLDREYVDAVEEIFAEGAPRDRLFEVAVCGGNDTHVAFDLCVVADALKHALLQYAQQLDLHGRAHVPDLIEEERAAFCDLKTALTRGDGAGEGALFVAEQLGFEQVSGNGAAVHRYEGTTATRTQIMDGARNDFFAGPGFTEYEGG